MIAPSRVTINLDAIRADRGEPYQGSEQNLSHDSAVFRNWPFRHIRLAKNQVRA